MLAARSVYDTLAATERRRLHRRAGLALEREPVRRFAELARHFREAHDADRWTTYTHQAADQAISSGDPRTAFRLLLDLLTGGAVRGAAVPGLVQRMPLYAAPGNGPLRELVAVLRDTVAGELAPAERTQVTWQLARLMFHVGDIEAASTHMEQAVPGLIEDHPAAAIPAMMMLARPLGTPRPAAQHRMWLQRAERLAATTAGLSPEDRLSYRTDHAATLLMLGDPTGWAAAEPLPSGAESPSEILQRARGYANLGEAAMLWGRYDQARHRLNTAAALADEHQYLRLRDLVGATLAHLDWLTGNWTSPTRWGAAALDADEPVLRVDARLLSGLLDAAHGDHRRAQEHVRQAIEVGRPRGPADGSRDPSAVLAHLAIAAGRPAEALAATDTAWQLVRAKGLWLWAAEIAPLRIRALLAQQRTDDAAQAADDFATGTRTLDAPAATAARALIAALLARAHDDPTAGTLFDNAASAWLELPRPYEALLAREAAARCYLAAGDRDRAVGMLRDVFGDFTALGATVDADRVRRSLSEEGIRTVARVGRPGYGDRLSPRELDVVRLLVQGRTSAQIARVLGLSPRTVDKHVHSAMRKRDVPSRTALAVDAVESGDLTPPDGSTEPPFTG